MPCRSAKEGLGSAARVTVGDPLRICKIALRISSTIDTDKVRTPLPPPCWAQARITVPRPRCSNRRWSCGQPNYVVGNGKEPASHPAAALPARFPGVIHESEQQ
jgi:hypothetical protein